MIQILLVDDDRQFLNIIKLCLDEIILHSQFCDYTFNIISAYNSKTASDYCINNKIDIALLDIDMPEVNGFDLATLINQSKSNTKIIFVSNMDNMVYASFKFQPFRFIRKSHVHSELKEAVDAALKDLFLNNHFITLGSKFDNTQIFLKDILFVESKKNYAEIVTVDNKYTYRSTISQLSEEWKNYDFIRIHAAFLVNIRKIKMLYGDTLELENKTKLNISRKYKSLVHKAYFEFLRR